VRSAAMLFMGERVAALAATLEVLLCAIAAVLDSTSTVASVMIETFILISFSLVLLVNDSNPAEELCSVAGLSTDREKC
jgi:hypothetical protein